MTSDCFDFNAYLEKFTGVKGWDIEDLVGGAANFTVRVRRKETQGNADDKELLHPRMSEDCKAIFNTRSSVVIKQAPPFLAKSPEMPFSPYRQTIEAEALRVFHSSLLNLEDTCLPDVLTQNSCILVPELLLHDSSNNVLIQSDLGPLPNLYDVLTSHKSTVSTALELGKIIGNFLADMHNCSTIGPLHVQKFLNEDSERVMEAVIAQAIRFMQDAGVSDFDSLGQMALNHWATRRKAVFAQGDLWFGTLLVDLEPSWQTGVDKPPIVAVGICDWEFAGPNDAAADVAQLGSYINLLSIRQMTTPQEHEIITAFAEAFYGSYFTSLKCPPSFEFWKSLLIMHGWEMVNAAGWDSRQHMWCGCVGPGVRCNHIKTMIEEGAKFLRAAGPGSENFNWPILDEIRWSSLFHLDAYRTGRQ